MLISDDTYTPIIIENIEVPMKTDKFWTLDLYYKDFMLSSLNMFEELTGKGSLLVSIAGYEMEFPAYWNILIMSEETSQIDIIDFKKACERPFFALIYNHQKDKIKCEKIRILEYYPEYKLASPTINKKRMLCHPLGPENWICVSPLDNYNKYLKNSVIGDLF